MLHNQLLITITAPVFFHTHGCSSYSYCRRSLADNWRTLILLCGRFCLSVVQFCCALHAHILPTVFDQRFVRVCGCIFSLRICLSFCPSQITLGFSYYQSVHTLLFRYAHSITRSPLVAHVNGFKQGRLRYTSIFLLLEACLLMCTQLPMRA